MTEKCNKKYFSVPEATAQIFIWLAFHGCKLDFPSHFRFLNWRSAVKTGRDYLKSGRDHVKTGRDYLKTGRDCVKFDLSPTIVRLYCLTVWPDHKVWHCKGQAELFSLTETLMGLSQAELQFWLQNFIWKCPFCFWTSLNPVQPISASKTV